MTAPGAGSWAVSTVRGEAAALHAGSAVLVRSDTPDRSVRILDATDRCVVLGSSQRDADLDDRRLRAAGLAATRRRSGGGAVMVGPGEAVWVDLVVPAGDALWVPDVGRAGWWLGDAWAEALRAAGSRRVETWKGPLRRARWSAQVCFAGLGPGEVTVGGRKVLGVSQRRTRSAALFQCALLVRWAPAELLDVLALTPDERARAAEDLVGAAAGVGPVVAARALDALLGGLADR